jgi:hypothetical protein
MQAEELLGRLEAAAGAGVGVVEGLAVGVVEAVGEPEVRGVAADVGHLYEHVLAVGVELIGAVRRHPRLVGPITSSRVVSGTDTSVPESGSSGSPPFTPSSVALPLVM